MPIAHFRKPIIAANWKMHMTPQESDDFLRSFARLVPDKCPIQIVVAPPFVSLERSMNALQNAREQSVELAALNQSLGERVQAQVGLIVERSKELAQLNAELRERVDQGARDLTALLRRVTGGGDPGGLAIGSVLNDRFELESVLGVSGMSVVYRARDRLTDEPVAVKVISPKSAHELGAMRRFLREARASVRVEHPAIVAARHIDLADGQLFAVFPFVEGTSLDRVLKRQGPLSLLRAVRIGRLIADALAATHAAGVVHRDIKPGNVMITPDESAIRLLDFGISKLHEPESPDYADTGEGVILGTDQDISDLATEEVVKNKLLLTAKRRPRESERPWFVHV